MIAYLETSAAAKLLITEAETHALETLLDGLSDDDSVVSSILLEAELRRLAVREALPQQDVSGVLAGVRLLKARRQDFRSAGLLPEPTLRSLDALHLASAMAHDVDAILTYDHRLVTAAAAVGVVTLSPA